MKKIIHFYVYTYSKVISNIKSTRINRSFYFADIKKMRFCYTALLFFIIPFFVLARENAVVITSMEDVDGQTKSQLSAVADTCVRGFIENDFSALKTAVKMNESEMKVLQTVSNNFQYLKKRCGAYISMNMFELKIVSVSGKVNGARMVKTTSTLNQRETPVTLMCLEHPKQAFVLYKVFFEKEDVVFTLVFLNENDRWLAKLVDFKVVTYDKKGYIHYRNLARKMRRSGNMLISFLFYQIAADLFDVSRYYRYETAYSELGQEAAFLKHENVCYDRPVEWDIAQGHEITVFMQRYFILQGKLYVHIFYVSEDMTSEKKLMKEAEYIYWYLKEHYPDLQLYFDGIFISAYDNVPKKSNEGSSTFMVDWDGSIKIISIAQAGI